jgi:hypothetical protein
MVLGTSINLAFNQLTLLTSQEYFIEVKTSSSFINCSRNNGIKDKAKSWLKEHHLQLSRGPQSTGLEPPVYEIGKYTL